MHSDAEHVKIIIPLQAKMVSKQIENIAIMNDWHTESISTADQILSVLKLDKDISIVVIDHTTGGEEFSLISEIKKINPSVCVILIMDEWIPGEARKAMNKGANDIVLSSVDLVSLSSTLERSVAHGKERRKALRTKNQLQFFQRELDIAAQIQKYVLPTDKRVINGYNISASMIPAKEIGGDFFDYFMLDDIHIGFVIGDVSGKGIPAALFMAVCRSLIKATALQGWSPSACLSHVNKVLSEDNPSAMFVTIFYGILNPQEKNLVYCSAGHDSPFLMTSHGEITALERTGNMALGFDSEVTYTSKSVSLDSGDVLFLYTDGITEAENPAKVLFGRVRLKESLESLKGASSESLIEGVIKKIRSFCLGNQQSDDITAMAVMI